MTHHYQALAALRDALDDLYPDEASARRVSREAGLDVTSIAFSDKAVDTWHSILDEAEKHAAVADLLAVARREYPNYQPLVEADAAYAQAAAALVARLPAATRVPVWVWITAASLVVVLVVLGIVYGLGQSSGTPTVISEEAVTEPSPATTPTAVTVILPATTPAASTVTLPAATSAATTPVASITQSVVPAWQPPSEPIDFDWVEIPAGEFTMGSDPQQDSLAFDTEQEQHTKDVDTFWIARTEVTVAQFAAFVEATGYQTTAEKAGFSSIWTGSSWDYIVGANWRAPRGPGSSVDDKQDHPVTHISWDDAQAFSRWAGVRLPTEAEWEKACRGAEDARIYPWGNNGPDKSRANYNMNVGDTTAVGSYPAGQSPRGLLDMSGNVWEWTQTKWRDNYGTSAEPDLDELGRVVEADDSPGGFVARVVRGGSFSDDAWDVRCAVRYGFDNPYYRLEDLGFRVVVSPFHP